MGTGKQSARPTYTEQLSDFASQLRQTMDDAALQQEVYRAIRTLLREDRSSETDIRRVLIARFEAGELRKETVNVVQRMLDRAVAEHLSTLPGTESGGNFGETDVIPEGAVNPDPDAEQLQPGSVLRDRYLLQQRVAGGSMGVVYKALDRRLAEVDGMVPWVAVKVLAPRLSRSADALRAIQQEAAKGRCLSHPNIVRFIDLDREDDTYFLVMEWIDGRSLADLLDDPATARPDLERVLTIVRQLARALDYAHRCGVVHADVKPGNVMVMSDGNVKLIDFGVARIRQTQEGRAPEFDPSVLGAATPAYSSMQVLTGEDPVPADDVFSLACLMYRLVAGYRVFGPRNAAEAAESGMSPQRPQGLSDHQWRTLKKALAFARVARFSSPKAFIDEFLRGTPDEVTVTSTDETAVAPTLPERGGRRSVLAGVLVAAAALAAVALLAVFAWRQGLLTAYLPPEADAAMARLFGGGRASTPAPPPQQDAITPDPAATPRPGQPPPAVDTSGSASTSDAAPIADERPAETGTDGAPGDATSAAASGEPAAATEPVAQGRPATHRLTLGAGGDGLPRLRVVLREDAADAVIDLRRSGVLDSAFAVTVEELSYSGNRSPWESGQFRLGNQGRIAFAPGQSTAQLVISMASDPVREADRSARLVLRDLQYGQDLGLIDLTLEDDDQRRFETRIAANTVGFAVSQVSVAENESAAQIDLVRFNPDASEVTVAFRVQDVTATRDEDYFLPSISTVVFAPYQRAARILVPLVQDTAVEADEAFFIELADEAVSPDPDIFRRVAVMIRDDDG